MLPGAGRDDGCRRSRDVVEERGGAARGLAHAVVRLPVVRSVKSGITVVAYEGELARYSSLFTPADPA
jgi:hypothetical protein